MISLCMQGGLFSLKSLKCEIFQPSLVGKEPLMSKDFSSDEIWTPNYVFEVGFLSLSD